MNISTVNELIQSLESAGELSIKETKVMALAKAYQQLAAENVALKAACGGDGSYRNCPACTFSEYIEAPETPVTDRIVAGIKADEEKTVLNDLLRHLDKIDIENLSSPWELSSEVVAFVNSRLLREEAK
ncbi:hypothetical protein [Klebsiella michiganensis]|nr:hypothetical protein [Klebsiella michiganensis]MBQ4658404.1 hypothetical protein [Klebsiella michiganensis]MBQ4664497.1 hypothetical protein [Klebsiella michiganensis]MBZ7134098.1 hypothetical protein [Klebsiella michiganensis]MDK3153472.1 hypothetical protein [Klebsiella michiganensis]MDV1379779.1 hypothetical protein [Klebsiella michiganensis]